MSCFETFGAQAFVLLTLQEHTTFAIGDWNAEGLMLNLVAILCYSFSDMSLAVFQQPAGPLNGLLVVTVCYHASIHAGGFYRGYKNSR
jgi:hypothetical protein